MKFLIMNGAGNRFAIFDARQFDAHHSNDHQAENANQAFELSKDRVVAIATPGSSMMGPKGADQVIIMRSADPMPGISHMAGNADNAGNAAQADVFMEIWNQSGTQVSACGNATRCVAWLLLQETGKDTVIVQTKAGLLKCRQTGENQIAVDMGKPRLNWDEIPLKEPMHTHHIDVKVGPIDNPILFNPGAVSMGNPHCVFFVEDFKRVHPDKVGPMIEYHPLFPEQANVGFARIDGQDKIRLKVWERGVGMTLACGTGACAAVVAAVRQNRTGRRVEVEVDGGTLHIEWRVLDDHVIMTGPVELEAASEI